jgi:ketosteroid isomerase-like protein
MSPESNTQLIQSIYAAFSRGDIPAILNALADDIHWEEYAHPAIPFGGIRCGKPAVLEFFQQLAQVEVASFEPQHYIATGDHVFVPGRWSGRVKSTYKPFKTEWLMHWVVKDNKVTSFRSYEDSATLAAAFTR